MKIYTIMAADGGYLSDSMGRRIYYTTREEAEDYAAEMAYDTDTPEGIVIACRIPKPLFGRGFTLPMKE